MWTGGTARVVSTLLVTEPVTQAPHILAAPLRSPAAGKSVVLTATGDRPGTVVATAFGWNAWPINTIVSVEGLPLQPWTAKAVAAVEAAEL